MTSDEQGVAALLLKEQQVAHALLGLFKAPVCPSNKVLQKFIKLPRAASREQSTNKAEHVSDTTLKLTCSVLSTLETSSQVLPAGIPARKSWPNSGLQARLGMRSQEFTWKWYTTPSLSASREPNKATKRQILV